MSRFKAIRSAQNRMQNKFKKKKSRYHETMQNKRLDNILAVEEHRESFDDECLCAMCGLYHRVSEPCKTT